MAHTPRRNSSLRCISSKPAIEPYQDSSKPTEMKICSGVSSFFWECRGSSLNTKQFIVSLKFLKHFIFIWEWKTRHSKFGMRSPFSIKTIVLRVQRHKHKSWNLYLHDTVLFKVTSDLILSYRNFPIAMSCLIRTNLPYLLCYLLLYSVVYCNQEAPSRVLIHPD